MSGEAVVGDKVESQQSAVWPKGGEFFLNTCGREPLSSAEIFPDERSNSQIVSRNTVRPGQPTD